MEHVCSSCSIEILGDFTKACKSIFSVPFLLVLLLLGAIFDPMTNFTAISASIFVYIFCFGVFSRNSFGRALVKLTASGFSSKTSATSSSAGLIGRLDFPGIFCLGIFLLCLYLCLFQRDTEWVYKVSG